MQCLGLHGRGDPDSLPAGDLAYLKLVGRLAGLGRRATIPEVEEFYAPYEPYRGLAGVHTIVGLHHLVAQGAAKRLAAQRPSPVLTCGDRPCSGRIVGKASWPHCRWFGVENQPSWERSWPTEQLAEFLDLISSEADEKAALRVAAERVAAAFAADGAAIVSEGVESRAGFGEDEVPESALLAVAAGRSRLLELPGAGCCHAVAVPIGRDGHRSLLVARSRPQMFSREEVGLLREMAHTLEVAMRLLDSRAKERELRQRAEDETRVRKRAEEDYRILVERLPAIVYTAELGEHGRWRYVSPQVEEILGYTPEEWLADPGLWASRVHPEDAERALEQETEKIVGTRNPPPLDYRMLTRDGDVVWILDEAVLELDSEGIPVWHGVLYDITERKIAEQGFERSAAQQAAVARLGEQALSGAEPGGPDGLDRRPGGRDRGRRARLCLGAAPGRADPAPARRPRIGAQARGGPGLGDPKLPRRSRGRVRTSRDRRRLGDREPLRDASGAAGARDPLQPRGGHRRPQESLRGPRRALDRAPLLHPQGRPLHPVRRQRPRRRDRAPLRRRPASPPGPPRRAHRPAQPHPVRRPARRGAGPGRRLRRPGRRAVPRPRPLQAGQRQPRPRPGRRAAAGDRAAAALRTCAPATPSPASAATSS